MNDKSLIKSFENASGVVIYKAGGAQYECAFTHAQGTDSGPLKLKITGSGTENSLLWKLEVTPSAEIEIVDVHIDIPYSYSQQQKIFINGYQSWTESREYDINEKEKGPKWVNELVDKKFHVKPYGDYHFNSYSNKRGELHAYTFSYIRDSVKHIGLVASLNERNGYTIIRHFTEKNLLRIEKDCSGLILKDPYEALNFALYTGDEDEVFDRYFSDLNVPAPKVKKTTGWTSWYHYYENITHDIIMQNAEAFASRKIPIDVFQIDDGYQQAVGDWLITNQKFPQGMKPLVDKIKAGGYKAGLWLAPFVCETKSDVYNNHPDWLLKDGKGKNICTGGNWSIQWALDIENPEVKSYLKEVFDKVFNEWGFDMVKLDFLYGACMSPPLNKTRGQVMYEAMRFLREIIGDKMILGCGLPLGSSFGLIEYCRIGCDLDLYWERKTYRFGLLRELLSSKSAMLNAISRRFLDKRAFLNDPDVFLLRHNNIHMSEEEKNTVFYVNHTFGGLVFTSDNLGEYTEDEYSKYLSAFPFLEKNIHKTVKEDDFYTTHFAIDGLNYLLLVNMGNKHISYRLPEGEFFRMQENHPVWHTGCAEIKIDGHSTICLLEINNSEYAIAGSSIHMFPGSEVTAFTFDKDELHIRVHDKLLKGGCIWIKIPHHFSKAKINGIEHNAFQQNTINMVRTEIKK